VRNRDNLQGGWIWWGGRKPGVGGNQAAQPTMFFKSGQSVVLANILFTVLCLDQRAIICA